MVDIDSALQNILMQKWFKSEVADKLTSVHLIKIWWFIPTFKMVRGPVNPRFDKKMFHILNDINE